MADREIKIMVDISWRDDYNGFFLLLREIHFISLRSYNAGQYLTVQVAQIIELSYEPDFWSLGGLWTHPGQFLNVDNYLWPPWVTLYNT
jgi:hypothetical protein